MPLSLLCPSSSPCLIYSVHPLEPRLNLTSQIRCIIRNLLLTQFRLNPIGVWAVGGELILDEDSGSEQETTASKLIVHEDYNPVSEYCDIGVVHLAEPFEFNDQVDIVQLPRPDVEIEPGTVVTVAGWGETSVEQIAHLL